MLIFVAAGATAVSNPVRVEAASKKGFQTIGGKQYYILQSGSKAKGWLTLTDSKTNEKRKYYFDPKTGVQKKGWLTLNGKKYYFGSGNLSKCKQKDLHMAIGWRQDGSGNRRYFTKSGVMVKGWLTLEGNKYYFDKSSGIMRKGWLYEGKYKYYFNTKTGIMSRDVMLKDTKKNIVRYFNPSGRMALGWKTFSSQKKCYFNSAPKSDRDGAMVHGFKEIDGKTYYFMSTDGRKHTGWLTIKSTGNKYYLNPKNGGVRVENTEMTIDGKTYVFDKDGVASLKTSGPSTQKPSGTRTIKNYLAGALQPVGQALYVWGGGWTDSTRKGVSPMWKQWYDSQDSSYDYHDWDDLSTENRRKGLDCSGFVGWATYQVMHNKSGEGGGYTVVSGDIGSSYRSRGWGSILTVADIKNSNYKFQPGDVGYNDGHTWIVLGQCSDKSLVIVHSTPDAGCQISGTPTPSGGYNSQAIELAERYMARYPGVSKYDYHESSGNYLINGNYFRWNSNTLSDPEGYKYKTADQILADLFS
ncbi:MAG: N-acetylmuramoyl-L-alanine amidase family protein [Eubacteriales bacterium]|nr:N-acetylmuramoyl-L-alanine amidase family protein [Eubacteriales bacterium]